MQEIKLGNGMTALIDNDDYPVVSGYRWYFDPKGKGYARTWFGMRNSRHTVSMHRLILSAPSDLQVDHINGNGLDNRRSNLRLASRSQNQQNTRMLPGTRVLYKGVYFDYEHSRFRAHIMKDKRRIRLGRFRTAEEAARAYDAAARELFGEFARLNFPVGDERPAR